MKLLSLVAVAASAHPIQDVLERMVGMVDESKTQRKENQLVYQKENRYCGKFIPKHEKTVKMLTKTVADEIASEKKYNAAVSAGKEKAKELEGKIADNEKKHTAAETQRQSENEAYNNAKTDLQETISAVEGAITTLHEAECTAGQALLQKAVLRSASVITDSELSEVQSFMQTMKPSREDLAACDSKRLHKILDIVKGFEEKFTDELNQKTVGETRAANAFELLEQAMEKEHTALEMELERTESQVEQDQADEDKARIDKEKAKADKEMTETELRELSKSCGEYNANFERDEEKFAEEEEALKEAMSVLSQVTGAPNPEEAGTMTNASTPPPMFVQIVKSLDPKTKAVNLIKTAAKAAHSADLAKFAQKVAVSPFKQINEQIQQYLFALKKSQTEDDNRNDWCKMELEQTGEKLENSDEKKTNLEAKISKAKASASTLEEEIAEAHDVKENADEEIANLTETRRVTRISNEKIIKESQEAVGAIQKAISIMAKFYATHGGRPAVSTNTYGFLQMAAGSKEAVMKLLEDLEAKYSTHVAEKQTEEEQEKIETKRLVDEKTAAKKGALTDIEMKGSRLTQTKSNIQELNGKKQAVEKVLHQTNHYMDKDLNPACVADVSKGQQTYEQRKESREKEVQGLKDAQQALSVAMKDVK